MKKLSTIRETSGFSDKVITKTHLLSCLFRKSAKSPVYHILRHPKLIHDFIDGAFGRPGSNRGIAASNYVLTLAEMLIDGAIHLEDVKEFENDEAYKLMTGHDHYPTSDAIGDWLRRKGREETDKRIDRRKWQDH